MAIGHSSGETNILVSTSQDNTCIVWDYQTGTLLRTYLLPSSPLSLALDPCDRACYVGFEDGSIQLIDFFDHVPRPGSMHPGKTGAAGTVLHPLFEPTQQRVPVQPAANTRWLPTIQQIGGVQSLDLSYDGTNLLSAHSSGKIVLWDVGRGKFVKELVDLSVRVTNLFVLPPTGVSDRIGQNLKILAVVKPKYEATFRRSDHDIGDGVIPGNYSFTAQFSNSLKSSGSGNPSTLSSMINTAINHAGFPEQFLESAMMEFDSRSDQTTSYDTFAEPTISNADDSKSNPQSDNFNGLPDGETQNDNAELCELVKRLRSVQKRTWEKYSAANLERIDLHEKLKMKEKELRLMKRRREDNPELDTGSQENDQRAIRLPDEEVDSSEDSSGES